MLMTDNIWVVTLGMLAAALTSLWCIPKARKAAPHGSTGRCFSHDGAFFALVRCQETLRDFTHGEASWKPLH